MSFANLHLLLGTPELQFAAEEVEGPAAAEFVEEELSEPEPDLALLAKVFELDNSLLLRKQKRHTVRKLEQQSNKELLELEFLSSIV